ncbi:MAG: hypothetical protein GIW97_00755 [Candidatus Eremiobacteraeota bacterium]|nr:hypothetical protein [Candidatus Eremiobacteraeota bacterium]
MIHSPVEVDEGGWRGRVVGVTRIGAKAGLTVTLALAVLFGFIIYGISTAGHRRTNSSGEAKLTKASEQQRPWWNAVANAQPSPPLLPSPLPLPSRVPALSKKDSPVRPYVPQAVQGSAPSPQVQPHVQVAGEREARQRALLDAAQIAPVSVRLSDGGASGAGMRQSASSSLPTLGSDAVPQLTSNATGQDGQNPDPRLSFLASTTGLPRDRPLSTLQYDPSPYELHAGSVIPATLLTGINADLPGTIVAQVRDDVFDSVTGRYLLIPRGTKLVGAYDSRIVQGQRRVLVAWTRLLYPDGSSLDLLGMAGTDPSGYAGFSANVDEHLNKTFNSALLLSIISAGAQLSQPQRSVNVNAVPDIGQTIAGAIGQQIGNTSIQVAQRQLQIPPTLEVPPGYVFDVLVDRDIVFGRSYADAGAL